MSSRYRIHEPDRPHFVTCTAVQWIHLFSEPELAKIILDSIRHLQNNAGLRVHGYVIMENHLHMIVSAPNLGDAMTRLRKFTAHKIVEWLQKNGRKTTLEKLAFSARHHQYQVWQEGFHPQKISGEDMLRQKLNYIHANPLRREFVDLPEHWRYSSARNYAGMKGILDVDMLT